MAELDRPATIISESPDEASSQRIKDAPLGLQQDLPFPGDAG